MIHEYFLKQRICCQLNELIKSIKCVQVSRKDNHKITRRLCEGVTSIGHTIQQQTGAVATRYDKI